MDGFATDPELMQWMKVNAPEAYEKLMQKLSQNTSQQSPSLVRPLFQSSYQDPYTQNYHSPTSQTPVFSQPQVDVVPETQPENQPNPRRAKGKAKATEEATTTKTKPTRNVQYNSNEDLVLISSYMIVSQDPIIGTSQKYATLFRKVEEKFEDARRDGRISGLDHYRTHDSLRGRFGRIRDEINVWLICEERATTVVGDRSGYNEADVTKLAQEFFQEKSKNHAAFNLFTQWDAMKKYPEWEMKMNMEDRIKKYNEAKAAGVDQTTGDDAQVGGEPMETTGGSSGSKRNRVSEFSVTSKRPDGRDKAKKMARGVSSGNSSMDAMSEGFTTFNENYGGFLEIERQKLEFFREREERKKKGKKMDYLMQLMGNYDNLSPQLRALADALQKELFPSE